MRDWRKWAVDAAERAVATAAQTIAALIGVDAFSALDADWRQVASVALGAGLLSVVKALAALGVNDSVSPASLASRSYAGEHERLD